MKLDMFAASGIALAAFLIASPATAQGARVDAEGKPTTDSTPAEKADTARINAVEGVTTTGPSVAATAQSDANNAQYQAQQQQYQQHPLREGERHKAFLPSSPGAADRTSH